MDVALALNTVTSGIGLLRTLADANADLSKAEIKLKAAELLSTLADVKVTLTETQDELRAKDAEIERLKRSFEERGNLVSRNQYKYFVDDQGDPDGFPICARCEQIEGRLIKLTYAPGGGYGDAVCVHCKTKYANARAINAKNNREAEAKLNKR